MSFINKSQIPAKPSASDTRTRINHEIKSFKVRLIDHLGNNLNVVNVADALRKAQEVSLDLVEVSPEATPPVCRIMDFGKYIFEKKKKEKDNHQKSPEDHEIRLTPNIADNDLLIKARKANEFLNEKGKVTVSFRVKGREAQKSQEMREVIEKFKKLITAPSTFEQKGGVYILTPIK